MIVTTELAASRLFGLIPSPRLDPVVACNFATPGGYHGGDLARAPYAAVMKQILNTYATHYPAKCLFPWARFVSIGNCMYRVYYNTVWSDMYDCLTLFIYIYLYKIYSYAYTVYISTYCQGCLHQKTAAHISRKSY